LPSFGNPKKNVSVPHMEVQHSPGSCGEPQEKQLFWADEGSVCRQDGKLPPKCPAQVQLQQLDQKLTQFLRKCPVKAAR
jgi:hypothetical protein